MVKSANTFWWQLVGAELPEGWAPVRLEGDEREGSARFEDLEGPRLAMRWKRLAKKPGDEMKLLRQVLRGEVGELASKEAEEVRTEGGGHGLLYHDSEPVKRDVAVMYFEEARGLMELGVPLSGGGRRVGGWVLRDEVLPGLRMGGLGEEARWSVFGLGCRTPAHLKLARHRLNVGDLSLSFEGRRAWGGVMPAKVWVTLREVAAPGLALQRMGMEGWLRSMGVPDGRVYKPAGKVEEVLVGGGAAKGVRMVRKRRYAFLSSLQPRELLTVGWVDEERDRLVLIHGSDRAEIERLAGTLGE